MEVRIFVEDAMNEVGFVIAPFKWGLDFLLSFIKWKLTLEIKWR